MYLFGVFTTRTCFICTWDIETDFSYNSGVFHVGKTLAFDKHMKLDFICVEHII